MLIFVCLVTAFISRVQSFAFQVLSQEIAAPSSHFTGANAGNVEVIIALRIRSTLLNYRPNGTTYLGGQFVADSINVTEYGLMSPGSSQVAATGYVKELSPITSNTLVFVSMIYNTTTRNAQITRIVRSNKNMDTSMSANNMTATCLFTRYFASGNYNANQYNDGYMIATWPSNTQISLSMGLPETFFTVTRLSSPSQDSDWNDPNFYRLIMYLQKSMLFFRQSLDAIAGGVAWSTGLYVNDSANAGNSPDRTTYLTNRITGRGAYGMLLPPNDNITMTNNNSFSNNHGWTMAVHFYLYDVQQLSDNPGDNITFYQQVVVGSIVGNQTNTSLEATLYFDISTSTLIINLTILAQHDYDSVPIVNYSTSTDSALTITSFPQGVLTLYMTCHFTYYQYPNTISNNYVGTALGVVHIYPQLIEDFTSPVANPFRFWITQDGSNPNDGRNINGQVQSITSVAWQSATSLNYGVSLRAFDVYLSLPDYSAFDATYPTQDFSAAGACFNPILPVLQTAVSPPEIAWCNNYTYWPVLDYYSTPNNCQNKLGLTDYCEYCTPGYGSDLINTRFIPASYTCITEANCTTAGFYHSWFAPATSPFTDLALCISCPANCPNCTLDLNCSICNSFSTLDSVTNNSITSSVCTCNTVNCSICETMNCDLCQPFNLTTNSGSILHFDRTTNTSYCAYKTNISCDIGYGLDSGYSVTGYSMSNYPTCSTCNVTNCYNCSQDYTKCQECIAPNSLINLNLALLTDYQNTYLCDNLHNHYMGLYENTTARVYQQCVSNCQTCTPATANTSCDLCIPNFYFTPRDLICHSNNYCANYPNGVYLDGATTTSQCQNCMNNCGLCHNATDCIQCNSTFTFYLSTLGTSNASTCIPSSTCGASTNTYATSIVRVDGFSHNVCLDCYSHCNICTSNLTCQQCVANYYLQPDSQTCITWSSCNVLGYFNDTTATVFTCGKCPANCDVCSSYTACTICTTSAINSSTRMVFHLQLNLCMEPSYCNSTINSYFDGTYCQYCKTNCTKCSTATNCWAGIVPWMIDVDGSSLVNGCPAATTILNSTHCIACPLNCSACTYDPANMTHHLSCTTCNGGYYLNQSNDCEHCNQLGQYIDSSDHRCYLCGVAHCDHCNDQVNCLGCTSPFYYQPVLKQCITASSCTNSYSSFILTPSAVPICPPCGRNCSLCSDSTTCNQCLTSTVDIGKLMLFHPGLNTCVDPSACSNSISSYPAPPQCQFCHTNCKSCSSIFNCWECQSGYMIDVDGSTCVTSCPPMSTVRNATHCISCPSNCQNCTYNGILAKPFNCSQCLSGTMFDESGGCTTCTQAGFFISTDANGNPICRQCKVQNCVACVGTPYNCSQCINQFYITANNSCEVCSPPLVFTNDSQCLTCKVDNCTTCNIYDVTKCDVCNPGFALDFMKLCQAHTFDVTTYKFSVASLEASIQFQHAVLTIDPSNVNFSVLDVATNNITHANISYVKRSQGRQDSYLIGISSLPPISDLIPKVTFIDVLKVSSAQRPGFFLNPSWHVVTFDKVSRYIPEASSIKGTGQAVSNGASIILAIGSIVSFNYAVIMLKIYQMMDFMLLYNVEYPSNFQNFIGIFQTVNPLTFLPDIFQTLYDDTCADLGEKFISSEMGCQFLGNCSSTFFIILCFVGARFLFYFLNNAFKKKELKIVKFIHKLRYGIFGPKGFFVILGMFDVDLHLGAFSNSKYYAGDKVRSIQNIGNNLMAATFVYLFPFLILYYYIRTTQILNLVKLPEESEAAKQNKELKEKYEFLIEERHNNNWFSRYYEIYNMSRNYLICMMVVGFYDYPYCQLATTVVLLTMTMALEIKYKPNESKMANIVNISVWTAYSLLSLCFFMTAVMAVRLSKQSVYVFIGYPMIFLFAGLVLSNVIPVLVDLGTALYSGFKKCRAKCKKQVPEETKNENKMIDVDDSHNLNKTNDQFKKSDKPSKEEKLRSPLSLHDEVKVEDHQLSIDSIPDFIPNSEEKEHWKITRRKSIC